MINKREIYLTCLCIATKKLFATGRFLIFNDASEIFGDVECPPTIGQMSNGANAMNKDTRP